MPEAPRVAATTLAPDWVCEILSPSTKVWDRTKKLPIYAREGVRHLWLLDPELRILEIYRLEGPHYALLAAYGENAPVRAEPFEAIELDLPFLWGVF